MNIPPSKQPPEAEARFQNSIGGPALRPSAYLHLPHCVLKARLSPLLLCWG